MWTGEWVGCWLEIFKSIFKQNLNLFPNWYRVTTLIDGLLYTVRRFNVLPFFVTFTAIRIGRKLLQMEPFKALGAEVLTNRHPGCAGCDFDSDTYWEEYVRNMVFSMSHFCGTCRMGAPHDPEAVVDPQLRYRVDLYLLGAGPDRPLLILVQKHPKDLSNTMPCLYRLGRWTS